MRTSARSWRAPVVGYGWLRLVLAIGAVAWVGLLHTQDWSRPARTGRWRRSRVHSSSLVAAVR
ncbi:MAG: hypothetical protein M3Z25_20355 [Actinomycetota bacterium]|nr:hypothetical protein [Actinomycetota bacterium]